MSNFSQAKCDSEGTVKMLPHNEEEVNATVGKVVQETGTTIAEVIMRDKVTCSQIWRFTQEYEV